MIEYNPDILQKRILESIPFGFIQVDLAGKIVYANKSAFRLLQLKQDQLIGLLYHELPWVQMNENYEPLEAEDHTIYQALNGKTQVSMTRILQMGEEFKWFSVSSSPFYDEEDRLIGAVSNFIDITDAVESKYKIKETRERYKQLIDEAPYAITIYNKEGLLLTANAKCEEYWKVSISEYVGHFNIFESDIFNQESQMEKIRHAFEGNAGEITATVALPHAENEERMFRIKYFPLFDKKGEVENVVYFTEDITNYVLAEQKTKEEELLKQRILDALGDGILVLDQEGIILNVNKSLSQYLKRQKITGVERGKSIFNLLVELEDGAFLQDSLESILHQKSTFFEHQLKLKDGKWYSLRITPLMDHYGAVILFQNINTRKEIELALEKSLRKYRNIYNKAPVMMHSIDLNHKIVSVSDFWLEKMGYERNEVIGRSPIAFMTASSAKEMDEHWEMLMNEGEIRSIAYRYVKKSGEVMDVLLSAVAEYDENGHFERSITGMIDVTDQKRVERQLQESRTKLLEAQRISRMGNFEMDVPSGIFDPSPETVMIMGFTPEQRNLDILHELIHPSDLIEFKEKLYSCISKGEDFFHIFRINHLKTGKIKWISGRGRMIKNKSGKVIKMIGTVQDISEQRQAEDQIRRLSDRILLATEIAGLGVWEYYKDIDEICWEEQMYSIFSNVKTPVKLEGLRSVILPDDLKVVDAKLSLIKNGLNFLEMEVRVKIDEDIKYLRTLTRIIRKEKGEVHGMIGVVYDITNDKALQEELKLSLDEKNILIKEVHHRVKNNMQLISSIMALKSYDLEDDAAKAIFDDINTRIKAMSVIHDKLYKFYNVSDIEVSEFLHHIAQELQVLFGLSSIKIDVKADRYTLMVDKALLVGLIVNELVSNAVKHSFGKLKNGKIEIFFKNEGNNSSLSVINSGEKIPKDALTVKSGIGVSLIKTFAKQLEGALSVDPRNGFKIDF